MITHIPSTTPNREIVTKRTINFPIALVFSAWSDPKHLEKWWGPDGFTNTFHEFNFRPGGKWRFVMHGPEKGNYKNECEFLRIDPPNLIYWKRLSPPLFHVLATFEIVDDSCTYVTFRMLFDSEEECNKLKKFVVDKNEENFDKLEAELRIMSD